MPLAFDGRRRTSPASPTPPRIRASGCGSAKVLHKVFVEVDEEGTEAAAATAVVMGRGAGAAPQPIELRFDRPFLFVLSDLRTGAALFIGRVSDPRAGASSEG